MSMASEAAIAAPIASPIWSLKYGKCHLSGDSTTPSSETNSDATTFLIRTSSDSMFQPNIRQAKYPLVALLRIGELLRTLLPRHWVDSRIGPVQTIKNHRGQRGAPATALRALSAERRQGSCTVEALQHRTEAKRHPPCPQDTHSIVAATVGVTGTRTVCHRRRARYTPIRIMAPPTIFSMLRTSPKKMRPEATPVMVIRY